MGQAGTGFSTSLDGFIAAPNGDVGPLFNWYFGGGTDYAVHSGDTTLGVSQQCAELLRESYERMGALVVGRRHFDHTRAWDGRHPMYVPVFVVTYAAPWEWAHEGSSFAFVTEGVERAVEQARAAAGDKDVGVGGAEVAQQCIKAGLVDEVGIDLVPVLLGEGIRFFDRLGTDKVGLERTRVVEALG